MNILFLSRWFPFPPDNGSKIRIHHLLRGLASHHNITLLSFSDLPLPALQSSDYDKLCSEIEVVEWKPFYRHSAKARFGFFSSIPRSLVDTYSLPMETLIRSKLKEHQVDLIIASQVSMAAYHRSFQGVPALFEEIELGLYHEQAFNELNPLKRLRGQLTWYKLQNYLTQLLNTFNVGTVVSENERQLFANAMRRHSQKIDVVPNFIDIGDYQNIQSERLSNHIVFTGSFTYTPNYHAMQWFVANVFPLILKEIPDVQLLITGDHAGLPLPSERNIILAGYVENIRQVIASCDVSIAPLWSGGGTRLKIIEAMAIGTPVVATSKGAEGLMAQNGKHLFITDDPKKFAEHIIRLLRDRELRDCLTSNAVQLVKENYDWQVVMPKFLRLVEKAAAGSL